MSRFLVNREPIRCVTTAIGLDHPIVVFPVGAVVDENTLPGFGDPDVQKAFLKIYGDRVIDADSPEAATLADKSAVPAAEAGGESKKPKK